MSADIPRRPGFTFIELLISITIIAILIALLLPAVQQAREAARRTQCKNHLSQIALAIQNYSALYDVFPSGAVNPTAPITWPGTPQDYHVSWIVQILPQLELSSTFRHFDFQEGIYAPRNLAPQQKRIAILLCPSNDHYHLVGDRGRSHYVGVHNSNAHPIDVDNDGTMFLNSHVRDAEITDGLSNTFLVGETNDNSTLWSWAAGTNDTIRNTGWALNSNLSRPGTTPTDSGILIEFDLRPKTANSVDPFPPPTTPDLSKVPLGFSGPHSGGAQFALADGSVRFMSENIDHQMYKQLASRNDGYLQSGDY